LTALLLLTGCQPLKFEKTETIPAGEVKLYTFDAPRYDQKLTVKVSSPGAPVSIWLVKEEDGEAARSRLESDKPPTSSIASKENSEDITMEATIPAKTGYVLLVRSDKKKAEVKINVNGR
jgi:hypothetical protein